MPSIIYSTSLETQTEIGSNQLSGTANMREEENTEDAYLSELSTCPSPGLSPEQDSGKVAVAEPLTLLDSSNPTEELVTAANGNDLVEDSKEGAKDSSSPTSTLHDEHESDVEKSTPDAKQDLLLGRAVTLFGGIWPWRIRTCLAIMCAIVCMVLDNFTELTYSCVVLMITLDVGWLLFLLFQSSYGVSRTAATPLTWLSLIRVPFMSLPSIFLRLLDNFVLLLWLVAQFLRDIFIMLFITVLLRAFYFYL